MNKIIKRLRCPLDTAWSEQYAHLRVEGLVAGAPCELLVNGTRAPFQYTGDQDAESAEVMVRLGFERGEEKTFEFVPGKTSDTDLSRVSN